MNFSNYKLFYIIDDDGIKKKFLIKQHKLRDSMSGNDRCFCGSGKKQKKCHPQIHNNSVIANLYRIFNQIENETKNLNYTLCKKGCSDCCSDFFNVSLVEFFMILQYLKICDSTVIRQYSEKSKQLIKGLNIPDNDTYNIKNFPPCIFVDDTTHECKIYEVRPILCRLYGTIKEVTRCPKILRNKKAYENLINHKKSIQISNNVDFFNYKNSTISPKLHPLIYWFSKLDENNKFQTQKLTKLFQASTDRPVDEFIKILLL